jgi:outer membrane biogenesis lipoprotein LolB
MKRLTFSLLASGILFLAACTNEGSSTVATRDDDETTTPAKEQEHEATTGERDQTSMVHKDTLSAAADTTHTVRTIDSTNKMHEHK